jgi:16S rRNA (cytidine1402-2'-O)-methyltransferase
VIGERVHRQTRGDQAGQDRRWARDRHDLDSSFEGFLPRKGRERTERLDALATEPRPTVLYEAPHRIVATVGDLHTRCGPDRRLVFARELTKKFEEVWRGTLAEAVAHAAEVEARGEYVLVLEGAAPPAAPEADDIAAAVPAAKDAGASTRDAVDAVSAALGVSRRVVYDAAKRLP